MTEQPDRESTWQADIAILLALVLHVTLPTRFIPGSKWALVLVELLLLAAFYIKGKGVRTPDETRAMRLIRVALIAIIALANFLSLGLLLQTLIMGEPISGHVLVLSAIQIWAINVIAFALWYWEWDQGGPARHSDNTAITFRFPQDETNPAWDPKFFDYFYVSFTNASAFSPTDTMPMGRGAKMLMMLQALASLITVALIVGRAVNILGMNGR